MTNVTAVASQLSDNELIMGYRNGNYSDFETLLARHQSKVYGYIFSVVKDKDVADDIFQDVIKNSHQAKGPQLFEEISKLPVEEQERIYAILETLIKTASRN